MNTSDWQTKAAWMRDVGATSATWAPDGTITALTLGPAPVPPSDDDDDPRAFERASVRRTPAELKRIALGASGGPVRKV